MRMRKTVRAKKSTPRSKKSTRVTASVGQQAAALAAIGVVAAAAMLFAARHSSPPSGVAAADFQQEKAARTRSASDDGPGKRFVRHDACGEHDGGDDARPGIGGDRAGAESSRR